MGDDDVHNPFGDDKGSHPKKKKTGMFDPDYKGVPNEDPFIGPPDDSHWDEPDDEPSTTNA